MGNLYKQSFYEYSSSCCCSILLSYILPNNIVIFIQEGFISLLSTVPVTVFAILLVNLSTMLFILLLGLWKQVTVSFFLVLNGFALGILLMTYQHNIMSFLSLLFPHAVFEMLLIIVFCSLVKELSGAYRLNQKNRIRLLWIRIVVICVPLWLISGVLEGVYH